MIATLFRPLFTFTFRILPAVWRFWRDSREDFVSPNWLNEQKRSRVI